MKILVVGSGGIGGYFGGRLAAAGHDVIFMARGDHLAALRAKGLRIFSRFGDAVINPVTATERPPPGTPVDAVLVSVKLWDLEPAAELVSKLYNRNTPVFCLMNGVDSGQRLAAVLGPERVIETVVSAAAEVLAPGQILQSGEKAEIRIGLYDDARAGACAALYQAFVDAGVDASQHRDIEDEVWQEFAFRVAFGGTTAALGQPIAVVQTDKSARSMFLEAAQEAVLAGSRQGRSLAPALPEAFLTKVDRLAPERTSAALRSLKDGRRLETPWMNGTVVRIGRACGFETPANSFIETTLAPHVMGAQPGR